MNSPALNLMPHRAWARQAHLARMMREAIVAAALVLICSVVVLSVLVLEQQAQQAQILQYRQRLAQAQAVLAQRQQAQKELARIQEQRRAAQTLWRQQVAVLDLWGQIAKALPAGVYLSTLDFSPTSRGLTGIAAREADALAMQQALSLGAPGWQGFELLEVSASASSVTSGPTPKRFVLRALPVPVEPKP